jgi:hypothetical protein
MSKMIVDIFAYIGDERNMFAGLSWEKEIRSLKDPHIPPNPSSKYEIGAAN